MTEDHELIRERNILDIIAVIQDRLRERLQEEPGDERLRHAGRLVDRLQADQKQRIAELKAGEEGTP
jgi:hypothetical protein